MTEMTSLTVNNLWKVVDRMQSAVTLNKWWLHFLIKNPTRGIFEGNGLSTTLSAILHRYNTKLEAPAKAR